MQATNPFELFSPIHLAWLYRRHDRKLDVTRADLDLIEANCATAVDDPLFADYRRRADAGMLRRRPGRKPSSYGTLARLCVAKMEIKDEVEAIHARRRSGETSREYNAEPPGLQAANLVAHEFWFFCSGRTLLNRISKERIR